MENNLKQAIEEFLERHPDTGIVYIENFGMGALYDCEHKILYLKKEFFSASRKT